MTYRISGLQRAPFAKYFDASVEELEKIGARRVIADTDHGFPCRVSLEDARAGESLLLLNFVSHDVPGPFRTAHAIYIREQAAEPDAWVDALPPVFAGRTLSLRGFGADGMLQAARLAQHDEVEPGIAELLAMPEVACIHAHYAAYGCFAARIERHGEEQ